MCPSNVIGYLLQYNTVQKKNQKGPQKQTDNYTEYLTLPDIT